MVNIPLGQGGYERNLPGFPEIVLQNRFLEKAPSNLVEKTALITRAGSGSLESLVGGTIRGNFTKPGFLGGDLFVVSGHNLWRINVLTQAATQITGTIAGDGFPYVTWMKGIGYEYLFISDGTALQYFTEHAQGTATLTGNISSGMILDINGTYYGWNTNVEAGTPAGTSSNPYWALVASGGSSTAENNQNSLANMVAMLNNSGIPGQYSQEVTTPNSVITATSDPTHLYLTAIANDTSGNSITTSVFASGGGAISFGGTTLSGGGGTALTAVTGMGAGEVPKALATVSGFVLVSVGNSQKFYWLEPGTVVIDPLNFAEKESNPDVILDMLTAGDQTLIMGGASTENWYATGNFAAPFAPVEGRVYQRGVIEGTPTIVGDSVCLVGNDGIVYLIGYVYGAANVYGVHRVSDNGIEERIRVQIRREQGLHP